MPMAEEPHIDAAVVNPRTLRPVLTMRPAPRNPMPARMLPITRVGSPSVACTVPPIPKPREARQQGHRTGSGAHQTIDLAARGSPAEVAFVANGPAQQQRNAHVRHHPEAGAMPNGTEVEMRHASSAEKLLPCRRYGKAPRRQSISGGDLSTARAIRRGSVRLNRRSCRFR